MELPLRDLYGRVSNVSALLQRSSQEHTQADGVIMHDRLSAVSSQSLHLVVSPPQTPLEDSPTSPLVRRTYSIEQ